jgi:hypothetical protein
MASSSDENTDGYDSINDSYNSQSDEYDNIERKIFGKGELKKSECVYCCICAGKHSESNCPNKYMSKSHQFNSVRENFAKETNFKQGG